MTFHRDHHHFADARVLPHGIISSIASRQGIACTVHYLLAPSNEESHTTSSMWSTVVITVYMSRNRQAMLSPILFTESCRRADPRILPDAGPLTHSLIFQQFDHYNFTLDNIDSIKIIFHNFNYIKIISQTFDHSKYILLNFDYFISIFQIFDHNTFIILDPFDYNHHTLYINLFLDT